jgi:hypothetical protein
MQYERGQAAHVTLRWCRRRGAAGFACFGHADGNGYGTNRPFGHRGEVSESKQLLLRHEGDRGGAGGNVELRENIGNVPVRRVLTETERGADFPVA